MLKQSKWLAIGGLVLGSFLAVLAGPESSAHAQGKFTGVLGTLRGISAHPDGRIQGVTVQEGSKPMAGYTPCSNVRLADHPHLVSALEGSKQVNLQLVDGKCFALITVNR